MYEITLPSGRVVTPPTGRCWRVTKEGFNQFINENRMIYGTDGNGVPAVKRFLSEMPGMVPWTWLDYKTVGHTQEGNNVLSAILGKAAFDYPKPVRLIEHLLRIASDKNSIILDSFAGSGTTAHAVLNLNKEDGGNRRFILVEMGEYAETLTAERVRRVMQGYGEEKTKTEGTGGGFCFYELGQQLLKNNEYLNPDVSNETIREYIWYMETRSPYKKPIEEENKYYLGKNNDAAYYFNYEKDQMTVLDNEFLKSIRTKANAYIIYADTCNLSEAKTKKYNITFKKIPRDIARL